MPRRNRRFSTLRSTESKRLAFLVFFQSIESLSGESDLTVISHIAMVATVNSAIEVNPLSTRWKCPQLYKSRRGNKEIPESLLHTPCALDWI